MFPCSLSPMQSEKDARAKEVAMAKVALAQLGKRGREEDSSNEDEIDARNFDSLKWRQELHRASKRWKIEDTTEEEISTAKKDALPDQPMSDVEAEEDNDVDDDVVVEGIVKMDLESEVPLRKVTDVQSPRELLAAGVCEYYFFLPLLIIFEF